ncbi:hypothetical protein FRB95_014908 [Tulasnella sp. JGI-2019a]|nr:hypothetical protein FRB93_013085 [Tulasnella sp. JGI-2019a]KAG9033366.1 hypothetical protein FRB95_014908 [Tulasnella sp. JGI-2019a]
MSNKPLPYDATPPPRYTSIRDIVIKQAEKYGDLPAAHWLDDSGAIESTLSYNDLHRLSFCAARYLRNQGVEPGDRVALVYSPSLDFFIAFLACQVLRAVPIPVPCPTFETIASDLPSILDLLEQVQPAITVLQPRMGKMLQATNATHPKNAIVDQVAKIGRTSRLGIRLLDVYSEHLGGGAPADEKWEGDDSDNDAYVQYTSGSTGAPKGVILSQRNITHQLAYVSRCMGENLHESSISPPGGRYKLFTWLPHWFASSLAGGFLWSLHDGIECYLMTPSVFTANPLIWLKAMSEHQINISYAPNSGYSSVLHAWKAMPSQTRPTLGVDGPLDAWNLSNCVQLLSGGETIHGSVIREFFSVFKRAGLKPSSFRATYVMAEHALLIAIGDATHDPHSTLQGKVSVGGPRWGVNIKIVDTASKETLPDGREGEIWVKSDSKAGRYVDGGADDSERNAIFDAKIKGQAGDLGYLRTGDLGFLVDNQLFVSGRLEDLIISNGNRHFPADIEHFMENHDGVVKTMALSLPPDIESESSRSSLIFMMEIAEDYLEDRTEADKINYCSHVSRKVLAAKGLQITTILLLAPHMLPMTITGKLARATARAQYTAGDVPGILFRWEIPVAPRDKKATISSLTRIIKPAIVSASPLDGKAVVHDDVLESVRKEWETVFHVPVDNWNDFFALGGSTDHAVRILYGIQNNLACPNIRLHDLMDNPTLEAYADRIRRIMQPSAKSEDKEAAAKKNWLWQQVSLPDDFSAFLPENRRAFIDPVIAGRHPPENIFLTGATGIVGTFVLGELLATHQTPSIYCLVRAKTLEAACTRLAGVLKKAQLWKPQYASRIIPVVGDLTAVRFGLSKQTFESIAADIKAVLHCGGSSELLRSYEMEEGQNVSGTKEAIRLALSNCRGRPVPLHYVSTIAVFDPVYYNDLASASEIEVKHPPTQSHCPGYAQTRWVAEQLVQVAARDYDLPAAVYRVGSMLGHSQTGALFKLDGPLNVFVENIEKLGAVSLEILDMGQCISTVDFVARAITASAMGPCPPGQVAFYHVVNGQRYSGQHIIEVLENVTGESLERVRTDDWWRIVDNSVPEEVLSLPARNPQKTASTAIVSLDFLALVSAYLPRDPAERAQMERWHGREWSTVQLEDRLRRLAVDSPNHNLYPGLLDELRRSDHYYLDKALTASLKWAQKETKRTKVVRNRVSESVSSLATPGHAAQGVQRKPTPITSDQISRFNVKTYFTSAHALAFLSLLLYILIGE